MSWQIAWTGFPNASEPDGKGAGSGSEEMQIIMNDSKYLALIDDDHLPKMVAEKRVRDVGGGNREL